MGPSIVACICAVRYVPRYRFALGTQRGRHARGKTPLAAEGHEIGMLGHQPVREPATAEIKGRDVAVHAHPFFACATLGSASGC